MQVLFGTDSHTCTAGAFGQFASGIGNTDAGFILGTGKLLVKVLRICDCLRIDRFFCSVVVFVLVKVLRICLRMDRFFYSVVVFVIERSL